MSIDTQNNLKRFENSLDEVNQRITTFSLSFDPEQLIRELTVRVNKQPSELISKSITDRNINLDYSKQLEVCEELKKVKGLSDRLKFLNALEEVDSEAKEKTNFLETVNGYVKLKVFFSDMIANLQLTGKYIRIIDALERQVNGYKQQIERLIKLYLVKYLSFQDDSSVTYVDIVDGMKFSHFLQGCHNYTMCDDPDETRLFNFRKIFNGWTEEIMNKLETGHSSTIFEDKNVPEVTIKVVTNSEDTMLTDYIQSVEAVITFFNRFVEYNNTEQPYSPLKNLRLAVGKTLLKSLKRVIFSNKNIYPLISSYLKAQAEEVDGNGTPKELQSISDLLAQSGWSRDGMCEIEFWMDDLISTWINDLMSKSMNEQKKLVLNIINGHYKEKFELKNIIQERINDNISRTSIGVRPDTDGEVEREEKADDNDDWNNAWDEQDDDKQETEKVIGDHKIIQENNENDEDEDGWDDWGDDGEENWNNEEKKIDNKASIKKELIYKEQHHEQHEQQDKQKTISYNRTTIADEVLKIIANYYEPYADLASTLKNEQQLEDTNAQFRDGFKKLITSYYMLISANKSKCYPRQILFYNDFNFIIQEVSMQYKVDLSACFDLSYRIVDELNAENTQTISDLIDIYGPYILEGTEIDDHERQQKVDEFISKLRQSLGNTQRNLGTTKADNEKLVSSIYLSIINLLFGRISSRLLSREEIGSDECDVLGELIDEVISMAGILLSDGIIDIKKVQSFHKLEQVKMVIVSNLKTILQDFYDAKFFELETGELINIIKALFVDSPKRKDVIAKIHAVRDVTDVDD